MYFMAYSWYTNKKLREVCGFMPLNTFTQVYQKGFKSFVFLVLQL